jgi:hypothetical protein
VDIYYNVTYYIFFVYNNQFYVFAHINGSKMQEITDNKNGIKILFVYEPEKPILTLSQNFTLGFKI